jgi:hypothetical protein
MLLALLPVILFQNLALSLYKGDAAAVTVSPLQWLQNVGRYDYTFYEITEEYT